MLTQQQQQWWQWLQSLWTFFAMTPTSFYFILSHCCFDPADIPDDKTAKYSSYFLFDWSWKRTSHYSYEVLFLWAFEMPTFILHHFSSYFRDRPWWLLHRRAEVLLMLLLSLLYLSFCGTSRLFLSFCSNFCRTSKEEGGVLVSFLPYSLLCEWTWTCLNPTMSNSTSSMSLLTSAECY